ncbi:MAG: rod shape-determining protein MreC [Patescibacteria group bacterium]
MKIKKQQLIWVVLFGFLLAIFGLDHWGKLDWLRRSVGFLSSGLRGDIYRERIVRPIDQYQLIQKKWGSCQSQLLELEEENTKVRRLLESGIRPETKLVLAKTLSQANGLISLVLDSDQGVELGAPIVDGRVLLGRVSWTDGRQAKGKLLTNSELEIPVRVWSDQQVAEKQGSSLADGILSFEKDQLVVKEILSGQKPNPGDWVGFLADSGDVFSIGPIKEVFLSEDKIFQQATVDWLADPASCLTVMVLVK